MLDAIINTLPLVNCYHACVRHAEVRQPGAHSLKLASNKVALHSQKGRLEIKEK